MEPTTEQIIASAMALPPNQRAEIVAALQQSINGDDRGFTDADIESAWQQEIGKRLQDIDKKTVKPIPSEKAWKLINGDISPEV
ncbi:MAG: addiction module protein [Planctomycetota bacterium]